jgi:hypothetical protein
MRLALEGADIVICDINKTVIDEAAFITGQNYIIDGAGVWR